MAEKLNEDVARTGDRNDVAGLEHEAGLGLYDVVAPADALHEQPMVPNRRFGRRNAQPGNARILR